MSGDDKPAYARISMSCGACGHLTTFDRTSKDELACGKCGRFLGLSGMAP